MGARRNPVQALRDMNSRVWELPEPQVFSQHSRVWELLECWGQRAAGPLSRQLKYPPPAVRICSPWGVSGLSETPHRPGHPRPVNADAKLGFPITANQSNEICFDRADGEASVPFLLDENCSKGRRASKTSASAQPGKTVWFPCGGGRPRQFGHLFGTRSRGHVNLATTRALGRSRLRCCALHSEWPNVAQHMGLAGR